MQKISVNTSRGYNCYIGTSHLPTARQEAAIQKKPKKLRTGSPVPSFFGFSYISLRFIMKGKGGSELCLFVFPQPIQVFTCALVFQYLILK